VNCSLGEELKEMRKQPFEVPLHYVTFGIKFNRASPGAVCVVVLGPTDPAHKSV